MTDKQMKKWRKERDKAILSLDIEKMKAFYRKWEKKGVYWMPIPSDRVLEISMRKMVIALTASTEEQKREAAQWLTERGYRLNLW